MELLIISYRLRFFLLFCPVSLNFGI